MAQKRVKKPYEVTITIRLNTKYQAHKDALDVWNRFREKLSAVDVFLQATKKLRKDNPAIPDGNSGILYRLDELQTDIKNELKTEFKRVIEEKNAETYATLINILREIGWTQYSNPQGEKLSETLGSRVPKQTMKLLMDSMDEFEYVDDED